MLPGIAVPALMVPYPSCRGRNAAGTPSPDAHCVPLSAGPLLAGGARTKIAPGERRSRRMPESPADGNRDPCAIAVSRACFLPTVTMDAAGGPVGCSGRDDSDWNRLGGCMVAPKSRARGEWHHPGGTWPSVSLQVRLLAFQHAPTRPGHECPGTAPPLCPLHHHADV